MLASPGCADEAELAVRVCGDLVVPDDADAIRITTREASGAESLGGVVELLSCPQGSLTPPEDVVITRLPVDYTIPGEEGERFVVAQAIKAGIEVARVETRVTAASAGVTEVTLQLARSCLGSTCPQGQTCLSGTCQITPFAATEPMSCTVEPSEAPTPPAEEPEVPETPVESDPTAPAQGSPLCAEEGQ